VEKECGLMSVECHHDWLMSLPATEYSTTSTQMIRSSVSPYTPTTHPTGCPFSPRVLLTSSNGTCRTDCSWTRTSRKHWSSALRISCTPLLCRDVGICGWRRSVGGQRHEGSRCRNWPSPDIPKTRRGGSTIVPLSFSGHPPYTSSTVYRTRDDTGLQSHTEQTGLLQLSAVQCSSQQHSGSAASAKQCSQDRSPGSKTISCPAITAWAALVAHSTQNRVQGGCVDLQESQQRHSTDIPQSSHQGSSQCTLRSSGVPLFDKPFARTDFAKRAFRCSAPTVWNSLPETIISADSLSVFKSRLKTYFFCKDFD